MAGAPLTTLIEVYCPALPEVSGETGTEVVEAVNPLAVTAPNVQPGERSLTAGGALNG